MKKKKIIFIDMYGVILKESKGYFIPYTFQHFPESEHERLTRLLRDEQLFTKAGNGELTNEEFMRELGYTDAEMTMKDYLENYLTLDPGFIPFAKAIQEDYELVLLSNDVWEWSNYITKFHMLDSYFTDKIISGEVHMRKPEKRIFEYAIEHMDCDAQNCFFIDNSVQNLLVANELGIHSILFNRDLEEYDGDTVQNFEELTKFLMISADNSENQI